MAFPFTHAIFTWIIAKLFQKSGLRISQLTWGALLFGSILPDIDFLLDWTFIPGIHRTVTHSLVFALLSGLVLFVILRLLANNSAKHAAVAMFLGVLSHVFIDSLGFPGIQLLWPFTGWYAIPQLIPSVQNFGGMLSGMKYAILDMGFGIAWIIYLWFCNRIKF